MFGNRERRILRTLHWHVIADDYASIGRTALQRLLFVDFLSLLLYASVHARMESSGRVTRYTIQELFYELKKLSVIGTGAKAPMVREVTKRQRDLFEGFDILGFQSFPSPTERARHPSVSGRVPGFVASRAICVDREGQPPFSTKTPRPLRRCTTCVLLTTRV